MVVYQTNLWDAVGKQLDASVINFKSGLDILSSYYNNTLYNVNLIRSLLSAHTHVILRTTPSRQNALHPALFEFNNAIRSAAIHHCLPCLDWAAMTSYVRNIGNIFHDEIHPSKEHSVMFAKTLVDFSRYLDCVSKRGVAP